MAHNQTIRWCYFFLFGRCVNADAAAVLAALLDLGFLRTLAAADAARALVTSLFDLRANLIHLPSENWCVMILD